MVGFDTPIMGTVALMAAPSSRAETATVRVSLPFMLVIVHTRNAGSCIIPIAPDDFCVCNHSMARKKRGRPPKEAIYKREARLDLRVRASEKRAFKLAAANMQQDLSVWIRIQLHKAAGKELTPIETGDSTAGGAENDKQGKSSADRIGSV